MKLYTQHFEKFNISFDEGVQKFFITSKTDPSHPQIGGFDTAHQAIEFGEKRVHGSN